MNKYLAKFNTEKLAKVLSVGTMVTASISSVRCTDFFTGATSVLDNVSKGLVSIISGIAFIAIIINVILLFVNAHNEKKSEMYKEAIKKIFIYYVIAIMGGYLLSTIWTSVSGALGASNVISTKPIGSDGSLK